MSTAIDDIALPPAVASHFSQDAARRLVELRRDLHRHPELSWQEKETANKLVAALASFGITDVARVAGTGLVAVGILLGVFADSLAWSVTFTAIACIDWLGDGLCKVADRWHPAAVRRDAAGHVRVIAVTVGFRRLVERAHDKIRQASRGMPAVMIRQLDGLAKVMAHTVAADQRDVLLEQAAMILRASDESVSEEADRADVRRRYDAVRSAASARTPGVSGDVVDRLSLD